MEPMIKELNSNSLCEAMDLCCRNKRYKVMIVFQMGIRARQFMDEVRAQHRRRDPIPGVQEIGNNEIRFENGSCIEITRSSSDCRGHKCHGVLYDTEFMWASYDEYLDMIGHARNSLIPYIRERNIFRDGVQLIEIYEADPYMEYNATEAKDDNELDEFLNTFRIT